MLSTRAPVGYVAVNDVPMAFNQGCKGLVPGPELDAQFLAYVLQSLRPNLEVVSNGTTFLELSAGSLSAQAIPLPALEEQRAIADFLDRETAQIDAMIEAQETVVALAQEHRSSLIASEIESLSSRYPQVALRHCVVVQNGVTLGKDFGPDADEYPYLRVANVQSGYLDLEVIKTVRVSAAVAAGSTLRPGDVLITEGGDRAALGRGALWEGQIPNALHQNHIFALRCRKTLNPRYLVYVLDAPAARAYFESTRRQTTNLSSTNASKVRACAVPLPDVEHQREVVARLDAGLDRLAQVIAAAQDVLSLLRERREALITAAVTGRIDPHTGIERLEDAS